MTYLADLYKELYAPGGIWDRLWSEDDRQNAAARGFMGLFRNRAVNPDGGFYASAATEMLARHVEVVLGPVLWPATQNTIKVAGCGEGDEDFRRFVLEAMDGRNGMPQDQALAIVRDYPPLRLFLLRMCLHGLGYQARMRGWARVAIDSETLVEADVLEVIKRYLAECSIRDVGFVMGVYGDDEIPHELRDLMAIVNQKERSDKLSMHLLLILAMRAPVWFLLKGKALSPDAGLLSTIYRMIDAVLDAVVISDDDLRALLEAQHLKEIRHLWLHLRKIQGARISGR